MSFDLGLTREKENLNWYEVKRKPMSRIVATIQKTELSRRKSKLAEPAY